MLKHYESVGPEAGLLYFRLNSFSGERKSNVCCDSADITQLYGRLK